MMEISKPSFKKYLFVCEYSRCEGESCCSKAGEAVRGLLKDAVKVAGLSSHLRVSRSGCLDACAEGPNVLLMPDAVWFKRVRESDVPEIVRVASEGL
jgi:(2Fe-2S) ferredoxin